MLRTFTLSISTCLLLFSLTSIRCQSQENNCNDIFRYVTDNRTGEQVGLLRVPQDGADVLELKVNMTVNGIVKSSVGTNDFSNRYVENLTVVPLRLFRRVNSN